MSVTACNVCARPMRPKRTRAADYPGTVSHHGRGICATCYWRDTRPARSEPPSLDLSYRISKADRGAPQSHKHNVLALSDFLASRRARLAAQHRHLARSTA